MGSLYNNLGWTHHEAGRYERALDMFQKALGEREASGRAEQIHQRSRQDADRRLSRAVEIALRRYLVFKKVSDSLDPPTIRR